MLAILAATLLAVAPPLTPVSPRLVTVTADAKLTFPANQATFSLRIVTRDRDEKTVTKLGDEKQRKAAEALRAAGVEPRGLMLFQNGVSQEYRGNEVIAQLDTRTIVLVVTDLSKVDALLAAGAKQGATLYGSIQYQHTEQAPFDLKVRALAATQARERASAMVEALGGKLGLPRVVTDSTPITQAAATRMVVQNADGSFTTNSTSVELQVSSHLTVQFDVKDES